MRRPIFSAIRSAAFLSLLTPSACFSLPHVDPGDKVIADFAGDAGLHPTWDLFGLWTCSAFVDPSLPRDGGVDGGLSSGDTDAGQALTCMLDLGPGSPDPAAPNVVPHALVASFNLTTPNQPFDVDVATATTSGSVNLTGFSQFLFGAKLRSTRPGTNSSLPPGTELKVELRCSSTNPQDPLVNEDFTISLEATTLKPITLPLSSFMGPSQRQTCLAAIDGIGFVVVPGSAEAGTQIAGALQLDNIELK